MRITFENNENYKQTQKLNIQTHYYWEMCQHKNKCLKAEKKKKNLFIFYKQNMIYFEFGGRAALTWYHICIIQKQAHKYIKNNFITQ